MYGLVKNLKIEKIKMNIYIFQAYVNKLICVAVAKDVYGNTESNIISETMQQIINGTVEIVDEHYKEDFLKSPTYIMLNQNLFALISSSNYKTYSVSELLKTYYSIDYSKLNKYKLSFEEDDKGFSFV